MHFFSVFLRNFSPILSLFLFVIGNSFCSTYMASLQTHLNAPPFLIGLMTTSSYAGLMIGSFQIEKIIIRIAHIRSYAAFASIITAFTLLTGLSTNIYFWIFLRFFSGIAMAGVFIVIESWLLSEATEKTRGQILSIYMLVFYASQSLSQLFLKYESPNILFFFSIIAITSSLSVLPLAMTKSNMPTFSTPSTLKITKIFNKSASALYASFISGLLLSSIYGLFPTFLIEQSFSGDMIAKCMFSIIFGGMIFQYPIGKLSDLIERRAVLIFIGIIGLILTLTMSIFSTHYNVFLLACALFGGFAFTIYPVSISHACDCLASKDIMSGIQTLLLSYSIGAMIGPIFASGFMHIPRYGLYIYFSICLFSLVMLLSWRKLVVENKEQEESFITYPQLTPIAGEIDPRNEKSIS